MGTRAVPPDDSAWLCPREGLRHPPSAASRNTPAVRGHRAPAQPFPCLYPRRAPVRPRRRCCSASYHVWLFLSRRMTQIFVPGTCLLSRGGSGRSVHERGWQHGGRAVPGVPPAVPPAPVAGEGRLLPSEQSSLDPRRAGESPGGGTCSAHTGGRGRPGSFQVALPPPSRISFFCPYLIVMLCSPSPFASCARGAAVPPSRHRLSQLAAGTCPLACPAGATGVSRKPGYFLACLERQLGKHPAKIPRAEQRVAALLPHPSTRRCPQPPAQPLAPCPPSGRGHGSLRASPGVCFHPDATEKPAAGQVETQWRGGEGCCGHGRWVSPALSSAVLEQDPRGLPAAHHWGWCSQTPREISCSTIFIIAGLFAVKR